MTNLKPRDPQERFWEKVLKLPNGCWEWRAAKNARGYGVFGVGLKAEGSRRTVLAHRYAYETLRGPIADGLEPDHTCRNPACVNPDHLDVVTHLVNMRRSSLGAVTRARQVAKARCPQGHPYEGENLYVDRLGKRSCKTCKRDRNRRTAHAAR